MEGQIDRPYFIGSFWLRPGVQKYLTTLYTADQWIFKLLYLWDISFEKYKDCICGKISKFVTAEKKFYIWAIHNLESSSDNYQWD